MRRGPGEDNCMNNEGVSHFPIQFGEIRMQLGIHREMCRKIYGRNRLINALCGDACNLRKVDFELFNVFIMVCICSCISRKEVITKDITYVCRPSSFMMVINLFGSSLSAGML